MCAIVFVMVLPVYLFVSFLVVASEKSDLYMEAAAVASAAVFAQACILFPPSLAGIRRARVVGRP